MVAEASRFPLRRRLWNPEARLAYVLMAPTVIFLLAFMFYPIVYVFVMSLFKTNKLSQLTKFVGFKNYVDRFTDQEFWEIRLRSLYWTAIAVAVKFLAGHGHRHPPEREVSRAGSSPGCCSSSPGHPPCRSARSCGSGCTTPSSGCSTATLKATGLWANPPIWLGRPLSAFIACIWVDIWVGIPFFALVFLAGMQAVSEELYESAHMDGVDWPSRNSSPSRCRACAT